MLVKKDRLRMKILVVSHEFPPIGGGGANACYFLTREYVKAGHEVVVVTANYQDMPELEVIDGVSVIRVNSGRAFKDHCGFGEMAEYLAKTMKIIGKLEKEEMFDVCQVFFGIPSGPIGYWLKKKYRVPYIIRFGGGDIPGFQKRFKWVYKFISPIIKILWRNADALVANSNELKNFAESFYSKKPILVIHNGVDIETFGMDKGKKVGREIRILFVSRLIERKGLQHIIPMLKSIQSQVEMPIKLIVVGDGPYRERLKNMAVQYDVNDIVQFVGGKEKGELSDYYRSADIFILPSRMEGMPNVVLEAMACGLPIVMTPCGGSEELVKENGYVAPIEQFDKALIKLCNDTNLRLAMGEAGRKAAEAEFGWDKKAEAYLEILSKYNR